jgi:transcriptional regulator with XRE-family HTH domain
MIRNERQYKITKSQAENFRNALERQSHARVPDSASIEYLRWKVQRDAIESQLKDLDEDLHEYEALQNSDSMPIEINSFEDLPRALIQARIAAGLTQKQLAEKIAVKEQQIQRYEANDYAGAGLDRIQAVFKALGIKLRKQLYRPAGDFGPETVIRKLTDLGLDRSFVTHKLLPERLRRALAANQTNLDTLTLEAADRISRIFKTETAEFFAPGLLSVDESAFAAARFKVPAGVSKAKITAYTVYSHHLALLSLQATPHLVPSPIPISWKHVRRQILLKYNDLNLNTVTNYCWDLGIVVLPLNDVGTFHGATWRVQGRNVIVVKQRTKSEARWMIDILHELWHAAQNQELPEHGYVEADPRSSAYADSVDEEIATDFAADVLLEGRAEDIAQQCARVSNKRLEWLKSTVVKVARSNKIREDVLANYLAYRLAQEGEDWWATASVLQRSSHDPWELVRDIALTRIQWSQLCPPDRELLAKSLASPERL